MRSSNLTFLTFERITLSLTARSSGETSIKRKIGTRYAKLTFDSVAAIWGKSTKRDQTIIKTTPKIELRIILNMLL